MNEDQLRSVIRFVLTVEDINISVEQVLQYLDDNYQGEYNVEKATKIIKEMM